jgi:hypothetical protein
LGEKEKEKRRKKRKEGKRSKKRERKEEKEKCFLFFLFLFWTQKNCFFFRENTHVASSRSQRVSRVVVVVLLLLRVNVLMQKLNIRESCERKQD